MLDIYGAQRCLPRHIHAHVTTVPGNEEGHAVEALGAYIHGIESEEGIQGLQGIGIGIETGRSKCHSLHCHPPSPLPGRRPSCSLSITSMQPTPENQFVMGRNFSGRDWTRNLPATTSNILVS